MMMISQRGFNLIELMVVFAVVGTLAAIAIPQYHNYQLYVSADSALAEAKAAQRLVESQIQELGFVLEPSVPRVEAEDDLSEVTITTSRTFSGSNMDVIYRRNSADEWSCIHTFGIKLDGCDKALSPEIRREIRNGMRVP